MMPTQLRHCCVGLRVRLDREAIDVVIVGGLGTLTVRLKYADTNRVLHRNHRTACTVYPHQHQK